MDTKFEALWIGPYMIEKFLGYNSYLLRDMKGTVQMLPVNRRHLKSFSPKNSQSQSIYSFPLLCIFIMSLFSFCFFRLTPFPNDQDYGFLATHRGLLSHGASY